MSCTVADGVADELLSATLTCNLTLGIFYYTLSVDCAASMSSPFHKAAEPRVADVADGWQIKRGICNRANTLRNRVLDVIFRLWLQSGR